MAKLSHYGPCTSCGSADNLATYVDDEGEVVNTYCFTPGCTHRHKTDKPQWPQGVHWDIPERGLSKETCIKYDVRQVGNTHYFPYYGSDAKVAAIEYRDYLFAKGSIGHFKTQGSTMKLFFGTQAVHTNKVVAVAFGVYDAMAVYQVTGVPCLSTSDSRLKSCISHNYQWLASFQKIVIVPDNDESCTKALSEVEGMLPRSQVYLARLSFKDAGEYLTRDLGPMLKQAFYSALPLAGNLFVSNSAELLAIDDGLGIGTLSGTYIDRYIGGFRPGEVTIVMGAPTAGKTTYMRHVLASLVKSSVSCAVLSSEEGPKKFVGKLGNHIVQRMRTREDLPGLTELLSERLQVYALDEYKPTDVESFIITAVKAFGVKIVVIDNVSAISDAASLTSDVSNFIKLFNKLAAKLQCHIIVVSHTGRTIGADDDKMDDVALMQTGFGSSAIEKFAWNIVLVARKPSDPVGKIHVLKNRELGVRGIGKFLAAFDEESWTIIESGISQQSEVINAVSVR